MLKHIASSVTVLLALVAIGCTPAPAPPETPPDMREADATAIRALENQQLKAFEAKDADRLAAFYADDASVLMPNMPILNGRESVKEAMAGMLADPNFYLTFDSTKIEVARSSDYAYSQGTYTMATSDQKMKGHVLTEKGKYLTVFEKQADGTWRAVADMINADGPPSSAEPNLIAPKS